MAIQLRIPVLPDRQADKREITVATVAADVASGEVSVLIGGSVQPHRAVEILNGWRWLWNGIRDRDLLTITNGTSGPIYSYAQIDRLTEENRRTTWTGAVDIQVDDIAIAIHNDVAQQLRATNMIESAVAMLCDYCRENNSLETPQA